MPSFEQILFIGPHYKNHRGGIGAVLEIYSRHISPFNYIATFSYRHKLLELFFYGGALAKLIYTLLTNRKIKLVHIHGAKDGSVLRKTFVVLIARKLFRKKIVYHIHSGAYEERYYRRNGLYKSLCRFIINNADSIVVLSSQWFDFFQKNFRIKRILVIKNPVEQRIDEIVQNEQGDIVNFLFLGKIIEHKGIFDLVDLIGEEQEYLRGKCKLYAGGNHDIERLEKAIADKNISDIVTYIGWTQDKEKASYFLSCDYFILPTYVEAMPMTILEAFSYGKPVISTPVGSIPEILKHNEHGLLFEPGNKSELKKLIQQVINDPSLKERMAKNALIKAEEFYPSSIKKELEKLYTEIIYKNSLLVKMI